MIRESVEVVKWLDTFLWVCKEIMIVILLLKELCNMFSVKNETFKLNSFLMGKIAFQWYSQLYELNWNQFSTDKQTIAFMKVDVCFIVFVILLVCLSDSYWRNDGQCLIHALHTTVKSKKKTFFFLLYKSRKCLAIYG